MLCQIIIYIYLELYQLSHSTWWQELPELVKWLEVINQEIPENTI